MLLVGAKVEAASCRFYKTERAKRFREVKFRNPQSAIRNQNTPCESLGVSMFPVVRILQDTKKMRLMNADR